MRTPSPLPQPPTLVTHSCVPRPLPLGPPLLPLRRSQRECHPPFHPGNIYGERGEPSKQVKDIEQESTWRQLVGEEPPQAPDTPNVPGGLPPFPMPSEDNVNHLTREGGDSLVSFLCSCTIPFAESSNAPNYREWLYRNILKLPTDEQALWWKACETELSMLKECNVWEVTDRPVDQKIIKNHWVFNVKTDGRKKACLVAKDFSQVKGVNYHQIFSPVIQFETVRCMFTLTTLEGWHISGLNVQSTYLYGKLDEELYMEFPEGFLPPNMKGKVLRLLHAIYGLKQAGLAWWHVLDKSMQELGFEQLKYDAGLFVYKQGNDIVLTIIHVDNALFVVPQKAWLKRSRLLL